jgi:hypothetical protein
MNSGLFFILTGCVKIVMLSTYATTTAATDVEKKNRKKVKDIFRR